MIASDEFARLLPVGGETMPFVAFMESLSVDGLDLGRDRDVGRDIDL